MHSSDESPPALPGNVPNIENLGGIDFLSNIQILRFVAAMMVLLSHLEHETQDHRIYGMLPAVDPTGIAWKSGVDLFFIVSGFIMYFLTFERFGTPGFALEFLKRRVIRVVPLYWIMTFLMILAIHLTKGQVKHNDATPIRIIFSLLFFPISRIDGALVPVMALGWTLNYEMFFYACYTLAITRSKRVGLALLIAIFAMLMGLVFVLGAHAPMAIRFWGSPIIVEFLLGIALAHAFRSGVRIGRGLQVLLLLSAPAAFAIGSEFQNVDRWVWAGLPALLPAIAMALGPSFNNLGGRLLAKGGDASYALYLSHPFTLSIVAVAWIKMKLPPVAWVYIVVGVAICVLAAWVVYRWIETPLLAFLRRRFEPDRRVIPP